MANCCQNVIGNKTNKDQNDSKNKQTKQNKTKQKQTDKQNKTKQNNKTGAGGRGVKKQITN